MGKSCKLSALLQDYLGIRPDLSEISRYMTRRAAEKLIDLTGDIYIDEINFEAINLFKAYLIECKFAAKSVNNILKVLSPIFTWAISMGYLQINPCRAVKKLLVMPRPPRVLSSDEIKRLLSITEDLRIISLIWCGLSSMRKTEAMNLTWSEIDFQRKMIHLERKGRTETTWPWQTKNRRRRYLPLLKNYEEILLKMRAFLPDNQPYINLATQRWRRLLIRQEQGRLKEWERICPDGNFNRVFARIREDACIDAWYHDLRKTGITIMNRNLSLPETREIAGHSSSETTDIYLGIRPDYITRALNSFDGA